MAEPTQKRETRPEQYLREIRDLQQQNTDLLNRLLTIEKKTVSAQHWKTGIKVATALLPYGFSMFVAWTFYEKVQESFDTMKSFITDIPGSVTSGFSGGITENLDAITDTGNSIWENKDDLFDSAKETVNSYIIN